MLSTKKLKSFARKCGADLVGVGSMERFEGAPKEMDPRFVFPEAESIIGLAFRIPRGYFRGVEEGTHFFQYPSMGYSSINEVYAPMVLREVACFIEDNGYEGVVFRNTGGRGTVSDMTGSSREPVEHGRRIRHSDAVSPGKPAPDVFIHFRIAAFICGLGEIGYSKLFLTPEYGPRQRFAFVLTDAPLEPDPLYDGEICDRCMLCVKDCPVNAISPTDTVKVTVAGRELEWGRLSEWQCFHGYTGSVKETNPFLPLHAYDELPGGADILAGKKELSPREVLQVHEIIANSYGRVGGYPPAICAGRGCIRACMVHLEEQNRLRNTFRNPFRKRPLWRL